MAFLEFDGIAEDEAVALLFTRRFVLDHDLRAQADLVGRDLGDVDARQLAEPLAQLTETGLNQLLPLERSLVLAVLTQVAHLDGPANLGWKHDAQLMLKLLDFGAERGFEVFDHWWIPRVGTETKIRAPLPARERRS